MDRIVVGVDGSDGAQAALEWALEECRRRDAVLQVVAAWLPAPIMGFPETMGLGRLLQDLEADTRSTAEAAIAKASVARFGSETPGVEVVLDVRRDTPAHALIDAARSATLLVVGSRGLGGFRGLLLGSVGQQCAHHASCPVVIVRPHVLGDDSP